MLRNPPGASRVYSESPFLAVYNDWIPPKDLRKIVSKCLDQITYTAGRVKTREGHIIDHNRRLCENYIITDNDRHCLTSLARRVAKFVGVDESHLEPGVVIKYQPGGYFKPHHDFNNQTFQGETSERIATLMLYLNEDFQGGATSFPNLGIEIQPRSRMAIYWRYDDADKRIGSRLLHAGDPVLEGMKFVICFFIRNKPFLGQQRAQMAY